MKQVILVVLVISLGLFLKSCNTTEPPPDGQGINLKLEDVSCTEAWINLTTTNFQLPATITLKQNNQNRTTINLTKADTLLYVDSLLPKQTYTFIASHSDLSGISSNELSVTTMDTTSHNFTFETFTFGEHSSSVLRDVAIINENNIWAVGEIYINDSLGQPDPHAYNAAHWDGNKWELLRVMFYAGCADPTIMVPYPASSVIVFGENDIWISMYGDQVARLNGRTQVEIHCMPVSFSINKIWGTSSSDLYVVGSNGTIIRYNGTLWWRMGSLTTLDITDIWGDYNNKIGIWEILAVASNFGSSLEKEILQIENSTVIRISTSPQMWPLKTVWFVPDRQYYVAGAGIYQKRLLTDSIWKNEALDITTFSTYSIRGNNINDVIAVGAFGDFVHFNGATWKNDYVQPNLNYGSYKSVYVKGNIIVAVGDEYSQAVVLKTKK